MGEKFACGAHVVLPPSTPECAGKQQVQQEFSWHPCGNKPLLTQRQTNRSSECIHFARDAFMFFLPSMILEEGLRTRQGPRVVRCTCRHKFRWGFPYHGFELRMDENTRGFIASGRVEQ